MAFVKIQLPPGIERQNSPFDSVNRWWNMNQVRWVSGTIQAIGGWVRNTPTPLDSPIREIHVWRDNSAARAVLLGSDASLYVDASGSYTDITPDDYSGPGAVTPSGGYGTGTFGTGTYGTPRDTPSPIYSPFGIISMGQWGEDVIICSNTDGRLLYFDQSNPLVPPIAIGPSYDAVADATFTGSISGTILAVSAVSGTIGIDAKLTGTGVQPGTTIVSGSGATWIVSQSQSVMSTSMSSFNQLTTGAPVSNTAVVVTPERHVLAIGLSGNPKMIGWSSQEDPTDWNFASTTNTAGNLTLSSRTPLLYGVGVAEGTLVLSYTDVFLIRYVGQPSVYGGTTPISDTALLNPQSLVPFGGKAVWPSRQGFQLYSSGYVQPLPCPVFNDIMTGSDPTIAMDQTFGGFRIHGAHHFRQPEVWWFYPSMGQTECNRYLAWNYEDNFWFWGELPRSAMSPADSYQFPLMGGSDGHVYTHETGDLANGQSRVGQIWVESGALGLGNGDNVMTIGQWQIATGVGPANLNVLIYGHYTPEGTEYPEGPYTPGSDGWLDMLLEYRDVRIRLEAAIDGAFSVGLIRVDVNPSSGF